MYSYKNTMIFFKVGYEPEDQNSIQEEIKSRLKSGNAYYRLVQNLLSFNLLSKSLKIKIYRTVIFSVVLYRCDTWSLTLREESRLRVFENRVLGKIFGPKRDEVTAEWRKLHNEELHDLYSSSIIFRVKKSISMRLTGHIARMGESRVSVGKLERKRPLGKPRRTWEDNIKMNFQEVGFAGMEWIDLAEERERWWAFVNAVINLWVP
jgi:hypothetical protein